jgi:NitT/TauT family transport system permease protein
MKDLFALRGKLPAKQGMAIEIGGAFFFLMVWWSLVHFGVVRSSILPNPAKVLTSFPELLTKDDLIRNAAFSVKNNILAYLEAIAISLPLGFLIGLFPFFRNLLGRYVAASRFLPLSALIGLFILWYGIYAYMVIQFLCFGIVVYMLPVVVQRIDEVQQVYLDTVKTLGANKWQTIRSVFIPDVVSRFFDDILVLTAISYTYIIIAEMVNMGQGGIGAMCYQVSRASRTDKVFAILLVIIAIGFVQDQILRRLDKALFPHKHA